MNHYKCVALFIFEKDILTIALKFAFLGNSLRRPKDCSYLVNGGSVFANDTLKVNSYKKVYLWYPLVTN